MAAWLLPSSPNGWIAFDVFLELRPGKYNYDA
jgi:hypothetical protein